MTAIYSFLHKRDLSDFNAFRWPPETEAKKEIIDDSVHPLRTYVIESVLSGILLRSSDISSRMTNFNVCLRMMATVHRQRTRERSDKHWMQQGSPHHPAQQDPANLSDWHCFAQLHKRDFGYCQLALRNRRTYMAAQAYRPRFRARRVPLRGLTGVPSPPPSAGNWPSCETDALANSEAIMAWICLPRTSGL
jgi:hypothetical protein